MRMEINKIKFRSYRNRLPSKRPNTRFYEIHEFSTGLITFPKIGAQQSDLTQIKLIALTSVTLEINIHYQFNVR